MSNDQPDTDGLLAQVEAGHGSAIDALCNRHRGRLRRMVSVRMDPRLTARLDPSDVVQEALAEAARRLPAYLRERPLPFYPWLRQIAWERLVHLHDRHVRAQKRSVAREERLELPLPEQSAVQLANRLVAAGASPSGRALQAEMQSRVRRALDQMPPHDREVLVMWHLEELSVREIAALLELSEAGVKSRHRRALERLVRVLENREDGP
jgi:RNA polymerase sigma-70 factor (ECF subfamily)